MHKRQPAAKRPAAPAAAPAAKRGARVASAGQETKLERKGASSLGSPVSKPPQAAAARAKPTAAAGSSAWSRLVPALWRLVLTYCEPRGWACVAASCVAWHKTPAPESAWRAAMETEFGATGVEGKQQQRASWSQLASQRGTLMRKLFRGVSSQRQIGLPGPSQQRIISYCPRLDELIVRDSERQLRLHNLRADSNTRLGRPGDLMQEQHALVVRSVGSQRRFFFIESRGVRSVAFAEVGVGGAGVLYPFGDLDAPAEEFDLIDADEANNVVAASCPRFCVVWDLRTQKQLRVLRSDVGASAGSALPSRFIRVDAAAGAAVAHSNAGFTVTSLRTGASVTGSDRYQWMSPTWYLQHCFLPVADQSADDTRRCLLLFARPMRLWEFTLQGGPRLLAEWDAHPEPFSHPALVVLLPGVIAGLTADAKGRVCALSLLRLADNVVRQIPLRIPADSAAITDIRLTPDGGVMLLRGQGPPTRVSFRDPASTVVSAAVPAYKDRSRARAAASAAGSAGSAAGSKPASAKPKAKKAAARTVHPLHRFAPQNNLGRRP